MKLYELFPNFTTLSSLERIQFMRSYRERRALELAENIKKKKRKSGPTLTQEEKDLMKSLGIKQRDLALLKEIL